MMPSLNHYTMISRRNFVKTSALATASTIAGLPLFSCKTGRKITISSASSRYEIEPLIRPFGFKGVYLNELWAVAAMLESSSGLSHVGLQTQVLAWSDLNVFTSVSEQEGNLLMVKTLDHALQRVKGMSFTNPIELQSEIFDDVHSFGQKLTGRQNLRKTFTLNSMVALDNALWMLYAAENGFKTFDEMIPDEYRKALGNHHKQVAHVPLMAYGIPLEEIQLATDEGYFFMKIKIGRPGTQEEMLAGDMARIEEIHKLIGNRETPYTLNGKIPYYFDANGRYEKKETLEKLLDHARKIGMFDQIAIIEEPFPEEADIFVGDLGVRLAADESAHNAEDVVTRIQMGYGAIALKAAAKTLSMTMKMAKAADDNNVPCLLADLTCIPVLVDWNKNVASRLAAFPGIKNMGLLESNGHQNYVNWNNLISYCPFPGGSWISSRQGLFQLDNEFYEKSGGVLVSPEHYRALFNKQA
jgi:L-alanine-DL-glutamate epimerase-like enolase superfamily enzyme